MEKKNKLEAGEVVGKSWVERERGYDTSDEVHDISTILKIMKIALRAINDPW